MNEQEDRRDRCNTRRDQQSVRTALINGFTVRVDNDCLPVPVFVVQGETIGGGREVEWALCCPGIHRKERDGVMRDGIARDRRHEQSERR